MPPYTPSQPKRTGKRSKRIYSPASLPGELSSGEPSPREVQPRLLPDTGADAAAAASSVGSGTVRGDNLGGHSHDHDHDDQWEAEGAPAEFLYHSLHPDASNADHPRDQPSVQDGMGRFGASGVRQGKDEMNLAEFPLARLGRNDTRMSIEYRGQIIDKLGNVIEQRWIVSGNATFGLPTEFADRVLVALMYITSKENLKHNRPDRRVPFTTYRILRLLGLTLNQRNYAAVEKALQQLVGVTIYSEDAFWDHQQQRRITSKKGFHILEEFWLKTFEVDDDTRTEAERQEGVTGYVVWGERIWDSFQAGYIKNLDVEFYYALENTLARRLYRFLDKRMHYQQTYQIDIFDLAGRMGMKPYPFASQVARKLKPAFDELIARGFLARADVVRVGDFTRVRFARVRFEHTPRLTYSQKTDLTHGPAGLDANATEVEHEIEAPTFAATSIGPRSSPEPSQTDTDASSNEISAPRVQSITRGSGVAYSPDFDPNPIVTSDAASANGTTYPKVTTLQFQQLWANLLADYQRTLPPATFAMLANSQLLSLEDNTATISVEPRYREWLTRQMARQIKNHLNQHLNQLYSQFPDPEPLAAPAWRIKDVRITAA